MDFSKTLIRASCFGKVTTKPKDAGELSQTAKTYLKELYIEQIWGLSKELQNKFCDKGKMVEEESLTLLSRLDKRMYRKNDQQLTNKWFCGEPDIFLGDDILKSDYIIDAKSSWDAWSFISKLGETLDKTYWTQMQIYFSLTGAKCGEVSYCLVTTPQILIEQEKKKAFYQMQVATELNPDYLKVCKEIEDNATFDHIPMELRRIKFPVVRDDTFIEAAKKKIIKCREYLAELHKIHIQK